MSDKPSTSTQTQKKRREEKRNPTHLPTLFGGAPNLSLFPSGINIYVEFANVIVPTEMCEVSKDTRLVLPPPSSMRDHASYVAVDVDQIQMVRETER